MDSVFETAGHLGRFQMQCFIVPGLLSLVAPWYMLAPIFVLFDPEHRCRLPTDSAWHTNDTFNIQDERHAADISAFIPLSDAAANATKSQFDSCKIFINATSSIKCNDWVYDTTLFESTLTTELNLYCDRKSWNTMISTCGFAGVVIGVMVAGYTADLIGRRISLIVATWLLILSLVASLFSVSAAYTGIVRFFMGACGLACSTIGYVFSFEMFGPGARHHLAAGHGYAWVTGAIICPIIAYLSRTWRTYQMIVLSVSSIALLLCHFKAFLPETPRWLLSRGRTDEALQLVEQMMNKNRVDEQRRKEAIEKLRIEWKCSSAGDDQEEKSLGFLQSILLLTKAPRLLLNYLIICFCWLTSSMVYYGISMGTKNLPGNIFQTLFLLSAAEFIPNFVLHLTVNRIGRKSSFVFSMGLSGLSLLASSALVIIFPDVQWLVIATSMIGKSFNVVAFTLVYIWTGELYATNMRLAGLSTSSMCARFGSLFAPVLGNISDFIPGSFGPAVALLIFAAFSIISASVSCLVPETFGKPTPDKVTEIINSRVDANNRKRNSDATVPSAKPLIDADLSVEV